VTRRLRQALEFDSVMPWFGQGPDSADGRLYLGWRWRNPRRHSLKLEWNPARSSEVIDGMARMHKILALASEGQPLPQTTWSVFKTLVTPHPLGGCPMAATPATGVVDHVGRVFGQPGLYVMDGSIIPRAIGRNPSKTIAAVAERAVEMLLSEDDEP
jgi:cholesterol oxidase